MRIISICLDAAAREIPMPTLSPAPMQAEPLQAVPLQAMSKPQNGLAAVAQAVTSQEVDSDRLLQGRREVLIRHGNECYRLRHTRNDKLILTK